MNNNKYDYKYAMDKFPIAMAYVPWQQFDNVCENLEEGYALGTIFPELVKPFVGRRTYR